MTYRYDPELAAVVAHLPELDVADVGAARRALVELQGSRAPAPLPNGLRIEHRRISRDTAPDLSLTVFRPEVPVRLPVLLYAHGGGLVMGSAATDLFYPAELAARAAAVVVSVEYRLAPEWPFPAAFDDCWDALVWVAGSRCDLDVDASRIAVGGVSAGAGLAAAIALAARDRSGPQLCLQLLDIPMLDSRVTTASAMQFVDTPLWNRSNAEHAWRHYLGGAREESAYAAPALTARLSGLPPAYVAVCEFDPLRDEGMDYARRLAADATPVELHLYPGTFHGSAGAVPQASVSRHMRADLISALRRELGRPHP